MSNRKSYSVNQQKVESLDDALSLHDEMTKIIEFLIETDKLKTVKPEELGLDRRSGYQLYIDPDISCIVVRKSNQGALEYYGGFEYIDRENVRPFGGFVVYTNDTGESRVEGCFDHYTGKYEHAHEETGD